MTYRVPKDQLAFPRGKRGRQVRQVVEGGTFEEKVAEAASYRQPEVSLAALRRLLPEATTYEETIELMGYIEAATMRTMGRQREGGRRPE